jgi:alpha-tubulin suppressor-like RCC1 family protein
MTGDHAVVVDPKVEASVARPATAARLGAHAVFDLSSKNRITFTHVLRVLVFAGILVACGRLGFQRFDDSSVGIADVQVRDDASLQDGPTTCLPTTSPPSCTTTSATIAQLFAGTNHCCALHDRLTCWGLNEDGQLGFCTDTTNVLVPTESLMLRATKLAVGERHTCALLDDGQLWCWGSRYEGESGDGVGASSPIPRRIGGTWRDVDARRFHTCGVASDGTLWCWGHNDEGQLGLGDTTDRPVPAQVGTASNWLAVATGGTQSCALDDNGVAFCWGLNANGEVGDGTRTQRLVPTPVNTATRFAALSLGKHHSCGLTPIPDRAIWCWGRGSAGQLGNGKTGEAADEVVPVRVSVGPSISLATGVFHTCIVSTTGELFCWGENTNNVFSPQSQMRVSTPLLVDAGPFLGVSAGGYTTCVRRADGNELACMGYNPQGQLGDGTTMARSTLQTLCMPN